jgi:tetratricopeptide (TPR) repeat protein
MPKSLFVTAAAALLTGCASPPPSQQNLSSAYSELGHQTPNYASIITAADAYLAEQPTGPAAADALYLRGRALEEKGQRDPASPQKDFADASAYYTQALAKSPSPALEGLIRAGLGNTLYFQERYANAATELAAAFQKLQRDNDKAWALYRVGLCQQRTGQWDAADQTFAAVLQTFPNSEQATRARQHQGARAFFVQVGTYATPTLADSAVNDLKKQGLPAQRYAEQGGQNLQLVRVGPFPTYDTAHQTRQKVWAKYQHAMIIP